MTTFRLSRHLPKWSLATKLLVVGSSLLALALASITLTLWVTWKLEGGAAAVNEAGRVRMLIYRVALETQHCAQHACTADISRLDQVFHDLRAGDPKRPLFVPWNGETRQRFADLTRRWSALRTALQQGDATAPDLQLSSLNEFIDLMDQFVSAIEQHLSYWTSILRALQFMLVALAAGSALAVLNAGQWLVLYPMSSLRDGLRSVSAGDFTARIPIATKDEFGQLAEGFNQMTEDLQKLYGQLEYRVREKTASLEAERERLAALYDVSRFLAEAGTLQELTRGFASRIRVISGADAALVRAPEDDGARHVVLATDAIDAPVRADQHAQHNTATWPTEYPTLITVPVTLHQRVLAEIDLYYRTAPAIGADERSFFEVLCGHLASSMESLRAEAMQKAEAVATERSLIAQELHDSIAQSLAFMKIQIQLLRDALKREDASAVDQVIGELDAGVRESYNDVRELLTHFRTRSDAQAIEPALRSTLKKFEHQTGMPVRLDIDGNGPPLQPDVQVQVLHIVQEALTNIRKHAGARQVVLKLQRSPDWRVEVIDDGCGFAHVPATDEAHFGLRIMSERAQRIGARIDVQSIPDEGTRVVLTLPNQAGHAVAVP